MMSNTSSTGGFLLHSGYELLDEEAARIWSLTYGAEWAPTGALRYFGDARDDVMPPVLQQEWGSRRTQALEWRDVPTVRMYG